MAIREYIIKISDEIMEEEIADRPQELVRCKDCKWYDPRCTLCDNCGLPREPRFFCADGRRAEK